MNEQIENPLPENPFTPDIPVVEGFNFVGRRQAIYWLQGNLGQAPSNSPLTISGGPGMGKTSFLNQLSIGGLGSGVGVLYTDIRSLDSINLSAFLWGLAKAIMAGMERQDLSGPTIEKRMLVLNPRLVFKQRFWKPLLNRSHETPLLLAWDNFDSLAETTNGDHNIQTLRAFLYGLLESGAPIDLLITVTGRVEAIAENSLSPFRLTNSYQLTGLSQNQTLQLARSSELMPIFDSVGALIHEVTAGHPTDVQRLCHALFNRHIERKHGQITVADVLAVLQHELSPSDFRGAVYSRLARASFSAGRATIRPSAG
ncbi:MAG: ATP-binding protein [Chloroflexota bacterium]|nr:MAG: ATP-binding protein [Chloroflexota bacterium]